MMIDEKTVDCPAECGSVAEYTEQSIGGGGVYFRHYCENCGLEQDGVK